MCDGIKDEKVDEETAAAVGKIEKFGIRIGETESEVEQGQGSGQEVAQVLPESAEQKPEEKEVYVEGWVRTIAEMIRNHPEVQKSGGIFKQSYFFSNVRSKRGIRPEYVEALGAHATEWTFNEAREILRNLGVISFVEGKGGGWKIDLDIVIKPESENPDYVQRVKGSKGGEKKPAKKASGAVPEKVAVARGAADPGKGADSEGGRRDHIDLNPESGPETIIVDKEPTMMDLAGSDLDSLSSSLAEVPKETSQKGNEILEVSDEQEKTPMLPVRLTEKGKLRLRVELPSRDLSGRPTIIEIYE